MIDAREFLKAGQLLHGHKCPAMPLGLRAGAAAMNALAVARAKDKDLVAILELGDDHCAYCFADGVQMITGCTFRRRRTTVPAGYPGHPKEHVHEHCQRRHDDEHQPERIWLSRIHVAAIPPTRPRALPGGIASGDSFVSPRLARLAGLAPSARPS